MIPKYIPDIVRDVVVKVATSLGTPVYFEFGSDPVVTQELTIKDNSIKSKNKKYPLVWLAVPFEEVGRLGVYCDVKCDLSIITDTRSDYSMVQREATTFKPILYPIYAELLKQFAIHRPTANYPRNFTHTKIDFPYWGKNNENLFNDFIDAVQLKGLRLTIMNTC